jgi:hypothetical protein
MFFGAKQKALCGALETLNRYTSPMQEDKHSMAHRPIAIGLADHAPAVENISLCLCMESRNLQACLT